MLQTQQATAKRERGCSRAAILWRKLRSLVACAAAREGSFGVAFCQRNKRCVPQIRMLVRVVAIGVTLLVHHWAMADERPNVVMIVCDDQAWFDFGFMGNREIHTPNLDRLAEQSAVFTRGYVPTSVCRPSLATMITGRYPHEHRLGVGIDGLKLAPPRVRERFEQFPTLPKLLASRGYRSFQTGKWWEGDFRDAGFTHGMTTGKAVRDSVGVNDDPQTGREGLGRLDRGMSFLAGAEGLRIGREGLQPIRQFLDEVEGEPFFLWYAPMLPHTPHNPPPELLEKYKTANRPETIAKYMAMCEWFDQTCGELLRLIDEKSAAENTLVAFIVDNGYIQLPGINWFDKRSKLSPYEAGVRTPILLRWPNHITPARHDTLVHSVDLMPTILAACGQEPPDDLPGINLLKGAPTTRDTVYGATFLSKPEKPLDPRDTVNCRWCISDRWKLIAPHGVDTPKELYNVIDDAHEQHNMASERPDKVVQLLTKLDQWWPATLGR
jgi:arylsulfatase A-like enzyme